MNGYGIIAPNTFGKITGAPEPICEPMDAIAEAVAWATCTSGRIRYTPAFRPV